MMLKISTVTALPLELKIFHFEVSFINQLIFLEVSCHLYCSSIVNFPLVKVQCSNPLVPRERSDFIACSEIMLTKETVCFLLYPENSNIMLELTVLLRKQYFKLCHKKVTE
jgi:hypothetical protein